jgi:hypothetical protein
MPRKRREDVAPTLIAKWPLPPAATLGSSVRALGILLEVRARLPASAKKSLGVQAGSLVLRMSEASDEDFRGACTIVENSLKGIESLPVIPREIEDILAIKSGERHRWLKDGRLPSAGTRTVKLRGPAKQITFHVFDPRLVEEILDGDLVSTWREDDATAAAEKRRRAGWNRRLARAQTQELSLEGSTNHNQQGRRPDLIVWEEFEREGLLR